jgi:hypothetical protein
MLSVHGYRVEKRIHETSHSEVYAGTRREDGLQVILKVYRDEPGDGPGRAQREFDFLSRIDDDGVARPVALERSGQRDVLIVERFPGLPLSRYAHARKLEAQEFLDIALGLARSLARVHDARVIHKDIKLANVLIDPERRRTCLIDFGIAGEFGRAERSDAPSSMEGTLHYIAPEQTGRMGLGVDFRADLYSLGVSFYELLTGRPPFRSQSSLELIHAHIAAQPRPVAEIDPRVPLSISRIIDKLLRKDPELRYQTARGLAADLEECKKQLLAKREIDDELPLGTQDGSDRLRFPHRLYGREVERAELHAALERVSRRRVELVLLAGAAGIGKSSLTGVLREEVARRGGYLVEAKFDPHLCERPYSGFTAAFSALIDQILTESPGRLAGWREQLRTSLGAIGQVLSGLAPNLAHVVDDFPPVPPLGAREARERLALAVTRFVRAMARPAHPLVLFLDDLQWADAGSLFLLGTLLRSGEPESLLVVGGYRDNEVAREHPLMQLIEELTQGGVHVRLLRLGPLRLEDTMAMLADALDRPPAEVESLARRIGLKSQHNPLIVRRLMFHLWDRNLIRHEHLRGWVWDEGSLTEAEITDDVAVMVASRIDALPEETRNLIQLASVTGTVFEVELLVALAGADRLQVLHQLLALVEQGLIAPCREGFKFVHDRLREAAQSRLGPRQQAELHHRTARLLLERTPAARRAEVAFQLAEHLSAALERLEESERKGAIESFALAGSMALEKGAPASAVHYLDLARQLLRELDWQEHFDLAFDVHARSAEAALQTGRFALALERLDLLAAQPLPPAREAQVVAQRLTVYSMTDTEAAVQLALAALRKFGVHWPSHPSRLRVLLAMRRAAPIFGRADQPPQRASSDPVAVANAAAALRVLHSVGGALYRHDANLAALAVAVAPRLLHTLGLSPASVPSLLANYAHYRHSRRDRDGALHYAELALERTARLDGYLSSASRAEHVVHVFVKPWYGSRRSCIPPLELCVERLRETGDVGFAASGATLALRYRLLAGEPLAACRARCAALLEERLGEPGELRLIQLWLDIADGTRSPRELQQRDAGRAAGALPSFDRLLDLACETLLLCVHGHFDVAQQQLDAAGRAPGRMLKTELAPPIADVTFYRGLCAAALASEPSPRRRGLRRSVASCERALRAWARHGPDFEHMREIIGAERARLRGRTSESRAAYARGAKLAEERGFTHHAALAHERLAELLLAQRRELEADTHLRLAAEAYAAWGAGSKSAALLRRVGS